MDEQYIKDDVSYKLTIPGNIYTNVSFIAYLKILSGDVPSSVRVSSNIAIQVISVELVEDTRFKLILKTISLDNELDIRVYGA